MTVTDDPILRMLAPRFEPWVRKQITKVLRASRAQYRDQESERSHGELTRAIAQAQHVPDAARWGTLVDLIHAAVDLADNLADEAEDRAAGRRYAEHYADIPRASLLCLPTLLISAASAEIANLSGRRAGAVLSHLTAALGRMTHGQGLPSTHRRRAELVSGAFGAVYAMPLFTKPRLHARATATARWGDAIGVLGHRRLACRETPGPSSDRALASAHDTVLSIWPTFPPFRSGDALSPEALLHPTGPLA